MTGLMLKDMLNMKQYMKTQAMMLLIFGVIFTLTGSLAVSFPAMCVVLCCVCFITCMSYDEQAGWDKYALTMPLTRRDIVLARYMVSVIFVLAGAVLSVAVVFVVSLFQPKFSVVAALASAGAGILMGAVTVSVMMPLLYKLGVEKARLLLILCYLAAVGLVFGGAYLLKMLSPVVTPLLVTAVAIVGLVVVAGLIWLSVCISCKLLERKEY